MKSAFIRQRITYHGCELRSGWAARLAGIEGDVVVAWLGECVVPTEHLVDLEDAAKGEHLKARLMLHLIIEAAGPDLEKAVLWQRLLVSILASLLAEKHGVKVLRDGNDLYVPGAKGGAPSRKLTVSVATTSPVSALIHLGINVDPSGAPVAAIGLAELGIEPKGLGRELLARFTGEHRSIRHACGKVRRVP